MLEQFTYTAIISSLTAATIVLLLYKIGVITWLQMHGGKLIHELASCQFCIAFWINVVISVIITIFTGEIIFLLLPFPCTALTRAII